MGGAAPGLRRAGVFAIVLAIHIALIALALVASRPRSRQPVQELVTSWITLPPAPAPAVPPLPRRVSPSLPRPVQIEPPAMPLIEVPPPKAGRGPDWAAQREQAVAAALNAPRRREFVNPAGSAPPPPPSPSILIHHKGDEQSDGAGNRMVWINNSCYLLLDEPQPGKPTSIFCIDRGPVPGQLFKTLPAYKKYHPQ